MTYTEKKEEMMKKYEHAINAISKAEDKDIGVAFDMLEANVIRGATYNYVNVEEFKKDHAELQELAKQG